jgi:hypothetical protein
MEELGKRGYGRRRFLVSRELRAWRFAGRPGTLPSLADLAERSGIGQDLIAGFIVDLLNDEAQRALEVELGRRQPGWLPGIAELRRNIAPDWFAMAGELVVGMARGVAPSDEYVGRVTGVSRAMDIRQRGTTVEVIQRVFQARAETRTRGRPRRT